MLKTEKRKAENRNEGAVLPLRTMADVATEMAARYGRGQETKWEIPG
jgi:hypothetical protein